MRVALCISGEARKNIDTLVKNWKECLIDPTKADVFVATPKSRLNGNTSDFGSLFKALEKYNIIPIDTYVEHDTEITIKHKTFFRDIIAKRGTKIINQLLQQCYYVQKANELRKIYEKNNGFIYDWIIRSRADIGFIEKIGDLSKYPKTENTVFLFDRLVGKSKIDDSFAFGDTKGMNVYSDRIDIFNSSEPLDMPENTFSTELQLEYILNSFGIDIIKLGRPLFHNSRYIEIVDGKLKMTPNLKRVVI